MLNNIYEKMPFHVQNIMLSMYGKLIYKQRYGGNFYNLLDTFKSNEDLTEEEVIKLQNQMLKKIIKHAYEQVPYYRNLFNKLNIDVESINTKQDLTKIPILTKEIIKENPSAFIADNYKRKKLIKYPTGGSSGSPLIVYTTKDEIRYNFAINERRVKIWHRVKTGDKLATFLGRRIMSNNINKPPYWRKNYAYNQTLYSIYHMNDKNLCYYVENLEREKPDLIIGYVTPIYNLSKYILNSNIKPLKVKTILTSSETLYDYQREAIERAFCTKVCNGYSQAEGVSFISECRCGKLHVQPEYGVSEFLPVKDSGLYEIIGTTLFNYAMPLIRYKTNDLVQLSNENKCECGVNFFPIVDKIIGRDQSVIKTSDGRLIYSPPINSMLTNYMQIKEMQIIQKKIDEIDVNLVMIKPFTEEIENRFIDDLNKNLGIKFKINIEYLKQIPKTIGGKHRFIISELDI